MTLQAKMISGFVVLGALALLSGSVLVLGYAIAVLAIGAMVFVTLPPLVRGIHSAWSSWRARANRRRTVRAAQASAPAERRAA